MFTDETFNINESLIMIIYLMNVVMEERID